MTLISRTSREIGEAAARKLADQSAHGIIIGRKLDNVKGVAEDIMKKGKGGGSIVNVAFINAGRRLHQY